MSYRYFLGVLSLKTPITTLEALLEFQAKYHDVLEEEKFGLDKATNNIELLLELLSEVKTQDFSLLSNIDVT